MCAIKNASDLGGATLGVGGGDICEGMLRGEGGLDALGIPPEEVKLRLRKARFAVAPSGDAFGKEESERERELVPILILPVVEPERSSWEARWSPMGSRME
jgi:hypothetical protein